MELARCRTQIDKTRKAMNEDARKQILENDSRAKGVLSRLEPIETHLKGLLDAAEAMQEAERVAAKNRLLNDRKAALAEAVGEFTDMLEPYPDDYLANVPESAFKPLLESLPVQVSVRRAAAEQVRQAKELADKAERDRLESEAKAEALRLKQQAIEDQKRKADQEELEAKMAAFEKQQADAAELQRKADAAREARIAQENADRIEREAVKRAEDQAKLDAQQAILDRQRDEIAAERLQQLAESNRLAAIERMREQGEREAAAQAEVEKQQEDDRIEAAARAEEERQRLESLRPDIEKLCSWITAIENFADEAFPSVSPACEDLLTELHRDLSGMHKTVIHLQANYQREVKMIANALDLISSFGGTAGSHHKDWVIDQVTRALTGDGYDAFVAACCDGEDGPETYSWEVGIAP